MATSFSQHSIEQALPDLLYLLLEKNLTNQLEVLNFRSESTESLRPAPPQIAPESISEHQKSENVLGVMLPDPPS